MEIFDKSVLSQARGDLRFFSMAGSYGGQKMAVRPLRIDSRGYPIG
jgi:hypothetical protein